MGRHSAGRRRTAGTQIGITELRQDTHKLCIFLFSSFILLLLLSSAIPAAAALGKPPFGSKYSARGKFAEKLPIS